MNDLLDNAVILDKRFLGDAPEIDRDGRCTFPGCRLAAGYHVLGDGEPSNEVIDPREYHRGKVGYYRDELGSLAVLDRAARAAGYRKSAA